MGRFLDNMAQKAAQSTHTILEQSPIDTLTIAASCLQVMCLQGCCLMLLVPAARNGPSTQAGESSAAAPCCASAQR